LRVASIKAVQHNEEGHRKMSFFRWLQWRDLEPNDLREPLAAAEGMGERAEAPPVADEAR